MVITSLITMVYHGSFPAYGIIRVKTRAFSNAYGIFFYDFTYIEYFFSCLVRCLSTDRLVPMDCFSGIDSGEADNDS